MINKYYKVQSEESVFLRVPQQLAHSLKVILLPTELQLLLLLPLRNPHLRKVNLALVLLLLVLNNDLHNRWLLPVAQHPLHLYVLALPQLQKFAFYPSIQNDEFPSLLGLDLRLSPSVLHDFAESIKKYRG